MNYAYWSGIIVGSYRGHLVLAVLAETADRLERRLKTKEGTKARRLARRRLRTVQFMTAFVRVRMPED